MTEQKQKKTKHNSKAVKNTQKQSCSCKIKACAGVFNKGDLKENHSF